MSRTGSFPLTVAVDLLKDYAPDKPVILDPFCGKGTSLLAARLLGMSAYGIDVAPEAVICSQAKMLAVNAEGAIDYVRSLRQRERAVDSVPSDVKVFYHKVTLGRMLSVRDALVRDASSSDPHLRSNACFALACLLGILHGHASYSLSLPCAHAFSMSARYVRKYSRSHGLRRPVRDVRDCIAKKIARALSDGMPPPVKGHVVQGSASDVYSLLPRLRGKVDVILTSPPYLNAQTYAKDNWLRLWLLGYDHKQIRGRYIQTGSISAYREHMSKIFFELARMLRPGGVLICIAGDVRRKMARSPRTVRSFRTGELLSSMLRGNANIGLRVCNIFAHTVPSGFRYFNALSDSNGHRKARIVERVFIARKNRT